MALFDPGQCGKNTIISLIADLETVASRQIIVDGKTAEGPSPEQGVVFQNICLFPWLITMGNVEYGLKVVGVPKKGRRARTQKYIDLVGSHGLENSFPTQLFGNIEQRAGIVRSYYIEPKVLLMGEPLGVLGVQTCYLMQQEPDQIWQINQYTIISMTNNIEETLYLADRTIMISNRPTTVRKEYVINIPHPHSYMFPEFLALRKETTSIADKTTQGRQNYGTRQRNSGNESSRGQSDQAIR